MQRWNGGIKPVRFPELALECSALHAAAGMAREICYSAFHQSAQETGPPGSAGWVVVSLASTNINIPDSWCASVSVINLRFISHIRACSLRHCYLLFYE